MAVGITACGKKSSGDVYKLYTNGINSINNAVGVDLSIDTKMQQSFDGQTLEAGYSSTLKKQNKDGDKQDTSITVSQNEQSYTTEYVIDGSKAYVIIQDQYQELQPAQVLQSTGYNKLYSTFDADAVTNTKTEKKDGKTVYTMELDPSKAEDLVSSHLDGYMMPTDQMQLAIHNASVSVVFGKKNIPSQITYSYSVTVTQSAGDESSGATDTSIDLTTMSVYTVNALDDSVAFELPDMSALTLYQESSSGGDGSSGASGN